jgi:pimeloyl-ACP methyl ester carboxylesterase
MAGADQRRQRRSGGSLTTSPGPDPAGGVLLSAARRRWRDTFSIRASQRAGIAMSGDAELFYRRFGRRGETPVLIIHDSGHHDSRDWIDVASEICEDRAVVAFDSRGCGKSTGDPSQIDSLRLQTADIGNLLDYLGWEAAILVAHSTGGAAALRFAAGNPHRVAGLALVEHCPGNEADGSGHDPWDALASVSAPLLVVRAGRSVTCDDQAIARMCALAADATVVVLDCGHDVPHEAPVELAEAIRAFLPWI